MKQKTIYSCGHTVTRTLDLRNMLNRGEKPERLSPSNCTACRKQKAKAKLAIMSRDEAIALLTANISYIPILDALAES